MKLFYITLNNEDEVKKISLSLLEQQIAVCTNWFPISCAYRWEGAIKQEQEFIMIVKTKEGKRSDIERVIAHHITYTNCIAELDVKSINDKFGSWLASEAN